jgi:hypothetical protein
VGDLILHVFVDQTIVSTVPTMKEDVAITHLRIESVNAALSSSNSHLVVHHHPSSLRFRRKRLGGKHLSIIFKIRFGSGQPLIRAGRERVDRASSGPFNGFIQLTKGQIQISCGKSLVN